MTQADTQPQNILSLCIKMCTSGNLPHASLIPMTNYNPEYHNAAHPYTRVLAAAYGVWGRLCALKPISKSLCERVFVHPNNASTPQPPSNHFKYPAVKKLHSCTAYQHSFPCCLLAQNFQMLSPLPVYLYLCFTSFAALAC